MSTDEYCPTPKHSPVYGVCFFPGSRLPSLVMERLLTSLHDLLDPEMPKEMPKPPSLPLSLKVSVMHNVASGLAYLHERNPPVIHRDLSARNILLGQGMVAKIVDLGVARIAPRTRAAATMTTGPGAPVYMPPEATSAASPTNTEKSKYGLSIDIFSLGVVAIFTIGESFPCDLLAPTYLDEDSGLLVARSELQRRSKYIEDVKKHLGYSQIGEKQPLFQLIQKCLHNGPLKRPNIHEVISLLEEARTGLGYDQWKKVLPTDLQSQNQPETQNQLESHNQLESQKQFDSRVKELEEQLQTKNTIIREHDKESELKLRVQELEQEIKILKNKKERELDHAEELEQLLVCNRTNERDLLVRVQELEEVLEAKNNENAKLQSTMKKAALESQEWKKQVDELQGKGKSLARAEENIRRNEQQIYELEQRIVRIKDYEVGLLKEKDKEIAEAQRQLQIKVRELKSTEDHVHDLTRRLQYRESELDSLKTMSRKELERYLDQKKRADQAVLERERRSERMAERERKREEIRKKYGLWSDEN